jgi:DNA-binding FadR family transcriptional regulator
VLQVRGATLSDVSDSLLRLEPICAGMCAAREDRATEVVPHLQAAIERQEAEFDDVANYTANARLFHEAIVDSCGSETMKVVLGSLETIWSVHESSVWREAAHEPIDPDSSLARKSLRAALTGHQKILEAIEKGDEARATQLAAAHLTGSRASTLQIGSDDRISANLLDSAELWTTQRRP